MESKLKHLEFIQNLIARLNNNSFVIKGWAITLVAALFALAAKDANERYLIVTYISTIIFWLLDGYYLSLERQYRCLYNDVAGMDNTDFSMDATRFNLASNTWFRALYSRTLLVLYGSLVCLPLLLIFMFKKIW